MSSICKVTDRDEVDFSEESGADRDEGFLWPFMEPVNVGTVHNGRELPGTHSQGGAHRGETQYHLVRGSKLCIVCSCVAAFAHIPIGYRQTNKQTDTHTQSLHLQLPPDPLNEEAPTVLPSVLHASTLYLITKTTNDVFQFITWEVGGRGREE